LLAKSRTIKTEQLYVARELLRWLLIASGVGILAGSASALLLVTLNISTDFRESHRWIIALLPFAGLLVGFLYQRFGSSVEAGNNLLLEEIHNPQSVIPLRMTPLVLFGTAMSHLFGGSAGREGTALQMGASLADQLTKPLRLNGEDRRILLMAGISAGFGSVFGTPLAGALFGLEVLAFGRLDYQAIFPCLLASFIGDLVTKAWGVHHTLYAVHQLAPLNPKTLVASLVAGVAFGLTGMLFAKTTHGISHWFKKHISWAPARPFLGGLIVSAAVFLLGTTRYIGLGIPTISASFTSNLHPWDFAAKFLFTAVTLGSGFKGGEVTPLFYIGATLGNALSHLLPLPASLLAGMGFVAVFAGAANTPIASTLMALELFGPEAGVFSAIACVVSYLFSGHAGIYQSQRIGTSKHRVLAHEEGLTLALAHTARLSPPSETDTECNTFWKGIPPTLNQEFCALRLYFHATATHKEQAGWRRLFAKPLGAHLLRKAREAGIEQAVLHRVEAGYLKGGKLAWDCHEHPSPHIPQVLELIADEPLLQTFLDLNRDLLRPVKIVLLRAEEVLADRVVRTTNVPEEIT
jgi:H+/Cl- antiporter ClcA/PII-like signaling protein